MGIISKISDSSEDLSGTLEIKFVGFKIEAFGVEILGAGDIGEENEGLTKYSALRFIF